MVQLITTATARQTDPALLRECLNIVRLWLLEPENGGEPQLSYPWGYCYKCLLHLLPEVSSADVSATA